MSAIDNATTLLTTISDALREVYHPEVMDAYMRHGRSINRLFSFSNRKVEGDGVTVQLVDHNMHAARTAAGLNSAFPTPRPFGVAKYKVLASETDSANHFRPIQTSISITHLDLKRGMSSAAAAVDVKDRTVKDSMRDWNERLAVSRLLDSSALIGTINGTPTKADARTLAAAGALTTSGGARFAVDGGSLANFAPGMLIDSYTGATKDYTLQVMDYNPRDGSVAVYGLDGDGNPSASVDISGVADNDNFYVSGTKDTGLYSVGEWFKTPVSGDSFFGIDRTDIANSWMLPHKSGPSSAQPFDPEHLDDLGTELSYVQPDPEGAYAAFMPPELETAFRQAVGADVVIDFPTDEQRGKVLAQYGFDGSIYRHPSLGRITLKSDPLCNPNKIRFYKVGDWETLTLLGKELQWMPGDNGDLWYRMEADAPGTGRGKVYKADAYMPLADICLRPRFQAEIENITP